MESMHTPRVGKVDHKYPHKHNNRPSCRAMFAKFMLISPDDTRHDEVANGHSSCTSNQDLLATNLVDPQNSGDGEEEFDNADDTRCQKGGCVSWEFHVLEDEGTG
jgi:hypothetical protein